MNPAKIQLLLRSLKIQVVLVFFFFFGLFFYFQSNLMGFIELDSYFHIKNGKVLWEQGILHRFPWTTVGLWSSHYADKEFLFHAYLAPFTALEGMKIPGSNLAEWHSITLVETGHLALSVLISAIGALFFYILKKNQTPYPFLWTFLLPWVSMLWLYRINMVRPHVLSIFFFLGGLHFLLQNRWKPLFLLSFLYPLGYHAAFVLGGVAVIHQGVRYLDGQRIQTRTLLSCFAGLLLGYLCHPNFPENIYLFYVQNVQVLSHSVEGNSEIARELGVELVSIHSKSIFVLNWGVLVLWGSLLFWALQKGKKISTNTQTLFFLSLLFFAFLFFTPRFSEYWIPISMIAMAFLTRDLLEERKISLPSANIKTTLFLILGAFLVLAINVWVISSQRPFSTRQFLVYDFILFGAIFLFASIDFFDEEKKNLPSQTLSIPLLFLILGFILTLSYFSYFHILSRIQQESQSIPLEPAGKYIQKNIPPQKVIYHCCWDLFPHLFFFSHKQYYMFAMDPSFLYHDQEGRWRLLGKERVDLWKAYLGLKNGAMEDPYRILKYAFKADYILVQEHHSSFLRQLFQDPRFHLIYHDEECLLFQIQ